MSLSYSSYPSQQLQMSWSSVTRRPAGLNCQRDRTLDQLMEVLPFDRKGLDVSAMVRSNLQADGDKTRTAELVLARWIPERTASEAATDSLLSFGPKWLSKLLE